MKEADMADVSRLTADERQLFIDNGFTIIELQADWWTDEAVAGWIAAAREGDVTIGGGAGVPSGQAGAFPQSLPLQDPLKETGRVVTEAAGDAASAVGEAAVGAARAVGGAAVDVAGVAGEAAGAAVAGLFKQAGFWILVVGGVVGGLFFLTRGK